MDPDQLLGEIAAARHLALTALNVFVQFRASTVGADPVEDARIIAAGLAASFVDVNEPDAVRRSGLLALRRDGLALVDAARRFEEARKAQD